MTVNEIRARKIALGYSTEQLSRLSGVAVGTLQKILSGQTKAPRYDTLRALERVLQPGDSTGEPIDLYRESPAYLCESAAGYGVRKKQQGEFRISDYYALPEEQRMELIDGVLYDLAAPTTLHQRICMEIGFAVKKFIDEKQGTCVPFFAPVDVRLDEDDRTMVQPDFLIMCEKSGIRRWGIMGAPDFILEVTSPSTARRDYVIKAAKYMAAGVREYWLLDPVQERILIYRQGEDFPYIGPLSGRLGIGIYEGEAEIDLGPIAELIRQDRG